MQTNRGDAATRANFEKVQEAAHMLALIAVQACGQDRRAGVYTCMGVVTGALHIFAMAVSQMPGEIEAGIENFNATKRINADTLLFAAILAATASREMHGIDVSDTTFAIEGIIEFGPAVIFDAMQTFERATGRQIDGFLPPDMVSAARDPAARAAQELDKIVALRSNSKLN
jgi:hypothetical protein